MEDPKDSTESQFLTPASHGPSNNDQNITPETLIVDSGSVSDLSTRRLVSDHVDVVQNLIERCLLLYMNRDEVVRTLFSCAQITPGVTMLVWQRLEEQNADFFKAYYLRLKLKEQILLFNQLLEQQARLMNQPAHQKLPLPHIQSEAHRMPVNNLRMGYPVNQQLPITSSGHPQMGFTGGMPSHHAASEIPAAHSFQIPQPQLGFRRENLANSVLPRSGIMNPDTSFGPGSSTASGGQFAFASPQMLDWNVNAPVINSNLQSQVAPVHSAFPSQMASSEGLQIGMNAETHGQMGNSEESLQQLDPIPWDFSFPDLVFPELTNEEVEFIFSDDIPGPPVAAVQSGEENPPTMPGENKF